jgi:alanine racemase
MYSTTKAEINLNALTHNLNVIRSKCGGKTLYAVVKANAYGHGINIVAPHLHKAGVRHFAVSSVAEADKLSTLIPSGDILILGTTPSELINPDYIQTVVSLEYAKSLPEKTRCHVKVDTGMTRFGIDSIDSKYDLAEIRRHLKMEAIFTHFSSADSHEVADVEFTVNQQSKIVELSRLYNVPHHSQNSAGVFNYEGFDSFDGDMVRVGLALYGYFPELRQVMSLKSAIAQVREVGEGVPVSYGRTYVTESPCSLAVVPVGYADGYSRLHSNKGEVVIGGKIAPVRGRVCMDYIIVDVTGIDANVGDEVEVYGDIERIASSIGTIPYEVTCAVSERVPRIVKTI